LARESLYVDNLRSWNPANNIPLRKEEALEFYFVPTYSRIVRFGIGTESQGNRTYEISVIKDDEILYQEVMSHEEGYSNKAVAVNWKLKAGERYVLRILLLKGENDVSVMMSGNGGLAEYDLLRLDDMESSGQVISEIAYYVRPQSMKTLIFIMFTWIGILSVFVFSFDYRSASG